MRAITIPGTNTLAPVRINADAIQRIDLGSRGVPEMGEEKETGAHVYFAGDSLTDYGSMAAEMFIPDPQGAALINWWDKNGVAILLPVPVNPAPSERYKLVRGQRVRLREHDVFAAPETYCGEIGGLAEIEGTPIIYVRWDDGNSTGERYEALEPEA